MTKRNAPIAVGQVWELGAGPQRGKLVEVTSFDGLIVAGQVLYNPRLKRPGLASPTVRMQADSFRAVYVNADD